MSCRTRYQGARHRKLFLPKRSARRSDYWHQRLCESLLQPRPESRISSSIGKTAAIGPERRLPSR